MKNVEKTEIILYTVDDIQEMFKIGRTKAYELMSSDGFPSFKLNNKSYIERGKLLNWIDKRVGKTYSY